MDYMKLIGEVLDLADEIALSSMDKRHETTCKGARDIVLDVDMEIEHRVKALLANTGIAVLGEESAWQGRADSERF